MSAGWNWLLRDKKWPKVKRYLLIGCLVLPVYVAQADSLPRFKLIDQNRNPVENAVLSIAEVTAAQRVTGSPMANMDQIDREFVPHVLAVRVGTLVSFPNSDDTRHHVYSFSDAKQFELKLYHANEAPPIAFDTPGLVSLGCNIHDRMRGYIFVTEAEIFAVSSADGLVELADYQGKLPPQVQIWHPQLKAPVALELPGQEILAGAPEIILELPFSLRSSDNQNKKLSLEERLKRFKRDAD